MPELISSVIKNSLPRNVYILIKAKSFKTKVYDIEYDKYLNEQISQGINSILNKNGIEQESSNTFKKALKTFIGIAPKNEIKIAAKGLEDILNGKFSTERIENYTLKMYNPILRNISKKLGYSSWTELYSKIKYNGIGLGNQEIQDFIDKFKDVSNEQDDKITQLLNEKLQEQNKYIELDGLAIDLVDEDTHTYESEVPLKKVEDGFDIASYVYNKNEERSFTGFITDNQFRTAYDIKQDLISIRNEKKTFDIEINEEDEELKDCLFTSLVFSRDSSTGNGYNIAFSIIPIVKGNTKILNKRFEGISNGDKKHSSSGKGNKKTPTKASKNVKPNQYEYTSLPKEIGAIKNNLYARIGESFAGTVNNYHKQNHPLPTSIRIDGNTKFINSMNDYIEQKIQKNP